ncbi:hypothetical protein ACROYT_G011526 [Oculina patagonica]
MAVSALRFLVLWMIVCALFQTPEIQAQSTTSIISPSPSNSASSATPFSSNSSTTTPWNSSISVTSPNSTIGLPPSSAGQLSTSLRNTQSTQFISHLISRDKTTSQAPAATIAPTSPQQLASSAVTPKESVTTTSPTKEDSKSNEDELGKTEYILIACLCTFVVIFIAIIVLVVQIARLNKSVEHLKATSRR